MAKLLNRWAKAASLPKEILVFIIIKILFLYFLWLICFAHPLAPHMHMPHHQVANHLL